MFQSYDGQAKAIAIEHLDRELQHQLKSKRQEKVILGLIFLLGLIGFLFVTQSNSARAHTELDRTHGTKYIPLQKGSAGDLYILAKNS